MRDSCMLDFYQLLLGGLLLSPGGSPLFGMPGLNASVECFSTKFLGSCPSMNISLAEQTVSLPFNQTSKRLKVNRS